MKKVLFKKKNIIVDACMHLGDLIHATTIVPLIHKYNPDCKITFLVNSESETMFENCGGVERVIAYKYKSGGGYLGVYKMAQELKKYKFDASISLDPRLRLAAMMYFAGIPLRIGSPSVFGWKPGLERYFFNQFITFGDYNIKKNCMAANFQELVSLALGVSRQRLIIPSFNLPNKESVLFIKEMLCQENVFKIALCVNTVDGARNLSADVYRDVAKHFIDKYNAKIVGLGVYSDRIAFENVITDLPKDNIIDLVGKTNFQELNAVLRQCNFLINPDNGMGHFAAACDCPTVTIFTNADCEKFKPLHPLTRIVTSNCECIGMCDKRQRNICGLKCRNMINSNMIIDETEKLIRKMGFSRNEGV